jgi:CBS domain-containing protein
MSMTIKAVLDTKGANVLTISSSATLAEAASLLAENRIGAVPVMDGGKVTGIFSERDLVYAIARDGGAALKAPVSASMTSPAIAVEPETAVMAALSLMTRRRIRHLPVVAGDNLVGFISIGDLVKHRIERIEAEATAMRDYIQMA